MIKPNRFGVKKKTMDAVIDLAILIVVLLIAFKMMRWEGPVCANCDTVVAQTKLSPPRPDRLAQAPTKPGNVFFFDHSSQVSEGSVSPTQPPTGRSVRTVTALTEQPALVQDEIILDSDPDGVYGLLALDVDAHLAAEEVAGDDLILEEEIGLGAVGFSMASSLVQAGFAVTMAPQKWRRDSKRLDLTDLADVDNA